MHMYCRIKLSALTKWMHRSCDHDCWCEIGFNEHGHIWKILSLTLGCKSCCHQEAIYSSCSMHPAYSTVLRFWGNLQDTHTQVKNIHTRTQNCKILVFGLVLYTIVTTNQLLSQTGVWFMFWGPWFRWAKQYPAPNSTSVSPWMNGAISFSQEMGVGGGGCRVTPPLPFVTVCKIRQVKGSPCLHGYKGLEYQHSERIKNI